MLYFAYGSNLNKEQMKRRCPDSKPLTRATLKGYRLVFNRYLDIIESPDSEVVGALYEISEEDLRNLDRYEGFPKYYDRIDVDVEDERGNRYIAFAYEMVRKGKEEPSHEYVEIVKKGYEDWGIPKGYLLTALDEVMDE